MLSGCAAAELTARGVMRRLGTTFVCGLALDTTCVCGLAPFVSWVAFGDCSCATSPCARIVPTLQRIAKYSGIRPTIT